MMDSLTIGIILEFKKRNSNSVLVRQLNLQEEKETIPFNVLYCWSNKSKWIPVDKLVEKCYTSNRDLVVDPLAWMNKPGFILDVEYPRSFIPSTDFFFLPKVKQSKIMDLFARVGGISKSLVQAGIGKPYWAVEYDRNATEAYRFHNPDVKVYTSQKPQNLINYWGISCRLRTSTLFLYFPYIDRYAHWYQKCKNKMHRVEDRSLRVVLGENETGEIKRQARNVYQG